VTVRAGLVGVGPVGDRIVTCVRERNFPLSEPLRVMATSARTEMLGGEQIQVQETRAELFDGLDVVFFAGREGAKGASVQWAPPAIECGAYCIDNGSDFRLDPSVPLVVPEINMEQVSEETRLIASPNCSTIQLVVALAPLHQAAGIKRVVISSYQSVSGWGQAAVEEMERQLPACLRGDPVEYDPSIFARPIMLDCLPHIDRFLEDGYTKEELKMVDETRKILDEPDMPITATAVRVPIPLGHSESVNLEFEQPITREEAMDILAQAPGVVVIDGPTEDPAAVESRNAPEELQYPTTADLYDDQYKDMVLVGRIREDNTIDNGLNLWIVADNLRKGAATNVVQIAEGMPERGIIG